MSGGDEGRQLLRQERCGEKTCPLPNLMPYPPSPNLMPYPSDPRLRPSSSPHCIRLIKTLSLVRQLNQRHHLISTSYPGLLV